MAEYRHTTNNGDIIKIKHALKTCSYGIGLTVLCDIEVIPGIPLSTIVFKTKDPAKEIDPMEFFVFGIILGRDYFKPIEIKKRVTKKMTKLDKKKNKRKVIMLIEFEQDNKLVRSFDPLELEDSLLAVLKKALNENRLIIRETEIKKSEELFFETIIIG
ncbi:hypothetical protein LJF28_04920 [Chryseobacterium indologenes]|uniref:hypothetical protein n=1 Tax=Chryseobacterium indologenes TaxID=253 RepID=UPI001D0D6195|nr:hypothetical protein [Chryseobacterium indologenes]UDQ55012.1 hypothetical protein LJF28_04920 [Chryseobacterium indologenes]